MANKGFWWCHQCLSKQPNSAGKACPDCGWEKKSLSWGPILAAAKQIVDSYDTPVTLRQCFYRLVALGIANGGIPNLKTTYTTFSSKTAAARREGWFPDFIDTMSEIHTLSGWDGPQDALSSLAYQYKRDRSEGQPYSIYLGVEARGVVAQLQSWFAHLGVSIIAMGGYASQTYVDDIKRHRDSQMAEAVLLYAGDFDASGMDIERDFVKRADWDEDYVVRIALNREQVDQYQLPKSMGKANDTRMASFIEEHGEAIQVELEALPPDTLRQLFQDQLDHFFDLSIFEECMVRERTERGQIEHLAETFTG